MGKMLAAAVGTLFFGFGAAASAQCVLEIDSTVGGSGLSGTESRLVPIETRTTFECGVVNGTSCAVGTASGTCTSLTVETRSLSCDGACEIEAGGVLTCDGIEVSRSNVAATCLSGVCQVTSDVDGDEPFSDLTGVTVNDPAGLETSVARCASGDLRDVHSYGLFVVTP